MFRTHVILRLATIRNLPFVICMDNTPLVLTKKNRGDSFFFVFSTCKILISSQIHTCRGTWLYLQRTMKIFVLLNLLSVSICWFCFKYPWYWSTPKTQFSQNYNDKDLDKLCILIMFPMSYNLVMSAILKTLRIVSC